MPTPTALPVQRSPKQTLHHVWAPKLGRIVMLTTREQLHLWAMLEAHPGVTQYCERPAGPLGGDAPVADFWARREGIETWLSLQEGSALTAPPDPTLAAVPVEFIGLAELQRHRAWICNWLALLPYLTCSVAAASRALQEQVVQAALREATFEEIEHSFPRTDAVLTRTAIISALHEGRLVSADLQSRPWDRTTRVRAVSPEKRHAPQ